MTTPPDPWPAVAERLENAFEPTPYDDGTVCWTEVRADDLRAALTRITDQAAVLVEAQAALIGVIAVADRKTTEFDAARAVLARIAALASNPAPSGGGWEEAFKRWNPALFGIVDTRICNGFRAGYLAALASVQPAGWRLVPEEPTEEMVHQAVMTVVRENGGLEMAPYQVYRAMVKAAPAASTSTTEG